MGLKTIILKLHKPSKTKQEIIDMALLNYNMAFQFLIGRAFSNISDLKARFGNNSNQFNVMALSKWIDKDLSMELNQYDVQPFKDSLKVEFGITMAGYLRLDDKKLETVIGKSGFSTRETGQELPGIESPDTELQYSARLRPIYFCRYDTKRNYSLLYDKVKNRYYVKLYLLNGRNKRISPDHKDKSESLVYIHKDKKTLEKGKNKEAFIIMPLSFGKWQEEILREAKEYPECLKTARLIKKNNGYFLAVSIESGTVENIEPATFMGISRGLKSSLNYSVLNKMGEILSYGSIRNGPVKQSRKTIPLNELHEAANIITDIARANKSQVIVQNLAEKSDGLGWNGREQTQCYPGYRRREYNRMAKLLEYKLASVSLPPPVKVSSVDIFYTCRECGNYSRKNRLTEAVFICTSCGATMDIEKLGSVNLAGKLINYNSSKIKVMVSQTEGGIIFTNDILGLNCLCGYRDNQLEKLKEAIDEIIGNMKVSLENLDEKTQIMRIGLVKKLRSAQNFMDLIVYV